nr:xyloglucan galactosyltransferase XLT2-like [Ipomoea batatas]
MSGGGGFYSPSEADIRQWQARFHYVCSQKRDNLFTFVDAKRHKIKNDFRGMLMYYYIDEDDCRVVDCFAVMCFDGSLAVFDAFLHSDFVWSSSASPVSEVDGLHVFGGADFEANKHFGRLIEPKKLGC